MDWTTDLPTRSGRYFIRPGDQRGPGRQRGLVVTVSELGGELVAWAGPDLYKYFRMASLDRVHKFVNESAVEWSYIDDVTDWDWSHAPAPSDVSAVNNESEEK